MTAITGEPVAAADAQQSFTSLHRLRLSVLLAALPFGLLVLGLPLIAREMGASALAIGGLFSIYSLIIVALQPIVGQGLDRFGRRPFLIAGLLGYAFSNAVFGLASGVGSLYIAQLAHSLSGVHCRCPAGDRHCLARSSRILAAPR
jgi:MFS family permease